MHFLLFLSGISTLMKYCVSLKKKLLEDAKNAQIVRLFFAEFDRTNQIILEFLLEFLLSASFLTFFFVTELLSFGAEWTFEWLIQWISSYVIKVGLGGLHMRKGSEYLYGYYWIYDVCLSCSESEITFKISIQ